MEPKLLPSPSPEARIDSLRTLDQLRHARETEALQAAEQLVRRCISSLNPESDPQSSLPDVTKTSSAFDVGKISYPDLVAFDALGVSPDSIFDFVDSKSESYADESIEIKIGDNRISVDHLRRGVTLQFKTDNKEDESLRTSVTTDVAQVVIDRFKNSPGYSEVMKLDMELAETDEIVGRIQTNFFDPEIDRAGTLSLLAKSKFIGFDANSEVFLSQSSILEMLENQQLQCTAEKIEKAGSIIFRSNTNGLITELVVDKASGEISIGFDRDVDYLYNEHANETHEESIPFVDTECASEMFAALDEAGIMLHPKYQAEMTRIGDAERYGSVYSQLSREISKWVNRPERQRIGELFIAYNPDSHAKTSSVYGLRSRGEDAHNQKLGEISLEEQEVEIAEITRKLLQINTENMNEPAKVLFTMIQDSIDRKNPDNLGLMELPGSSNEVHMKDGACFDVSSYYIGAAGDRTGGIKRIEVEGVKLLEKTQGVHTFMLEEPSMLNGVRLPKGSLMQKGEDGGWAVLRLTPFCFDREEDILATGSEMAKTEQQETTNIRILGGKALSNLVSGA